MRYTVNFIFSEDGSKVLLQLKNRTSFAGKYNGVGGKTLQHEDAVDCCLREVEEETGLQDVDFTKVVFLGTLILPEDCAAPDPNGYVCYLDFFALVTDHIDRACQQPGETEELKIFNTTDVLTSSVTDSRFAGEGDLQMFIHRACRSLGFAQ